MSDLVQMKANLLELPGVVSATSLALPENLNEDDWQQVGRLLAQADRSVAWWLGDWWAFGEKHEYGSRKEFAEKLEAQGGFTFQACKDAGWVSRKIGKSRRRDLLPQSFHREVASLGDADAQDAMLDWAEAQWPKVTVRDLRAQVRMKKAGDKFNDPEAPTDKYRVFYADPPWQYGNERPLSAGDQRDHYKEMPLLEIVAMPVAEWALDDAVLFMWTTSAMLQDALAVVSAWGFEYKTTFVWDKIKHNMGHYNSVRHEILLVAVRGSCTPDNRKLFDSVVTIERTTHSKKPELFYEIIETLYPHGRRLEMFARSLRDGWDSYGNEI